MVRAMRVSFWRISAAGARIGSRVFITDKPEDEEEVALAWSGAEYGVAWQRDGEVYFTRIGRCF